MIRKASVMIMLLIVVLLFITNPTKDDFGEYIEKNMEHEFDESLGNEVASMIVEKLIEELVERDNYILLSVYKIDKYGAEGTYIGIGKMFIPIKKINF